MSMDEQMKALRKWSRTSQSRAGIRAMISLAASESEVVIKSDRLDRDPMLINVENGIVDLRTGELRPPAPEAYMTLVAPVDYHKDATCPTFDRFQEQIAQGDRGLIAFKKRIFGSFLTGSVKDQKLYVMYGSGANGKSTEMNVLRRILGGYAIQTASDTLIERRAGAATNDIARLRGKRLVVANETEAGDRLATGFIKQATGGEPVTARLLYQEYEEFEPTWKFAISTNHLPEIDGGDLALLRRLILIPYDYVVPECERDPDLGEKLWTEAPGIFRWMVEGCLEWQEVGLGEMPPRVRAALDTYRAETDPIGTWLQEECEFGDYEVPARELYTAFCTWCIRNDVDRLNPTIFGRRMTQRGLEASKKGISYRRGVRLMSFRTR